MRLSRATTSLVTSLSLFLFAQNFPQESLAKSGFANVNKETKSDLPAVLKADRVDGDQENQLLVASGNVEVSKGSSVVYADEMTYDKNGKTIKAIGRVKVKNVEVGNLLASKAEVKDDFSSGKFFDSRIFFFDGSYLFSPEATRKTPEITVLKSPIYSICPNPEISANNEIAGTKRDMFSIKTSETVIDRNDQVIRSKGGIFRFYDVPFLYLPVMKIPLPEKKRESGFLNPSYAKSTNLGVGLKIPYYFNIAPNMDLTTTPYMAIDRNQFLVSNEFRHNADYGDYKLNLELANNEIRNVVDTTIVRRTSKEYRWNFKSAGIFDFNKDVGLDFESNLVSDVNYLRDYQMSYLNYTMSKVNLDYIHGRSYHSIKTIKFQELENFSQIKAAPFILPSIDSHIETKPYFFKEKFSLTSNMTMISREDGLQYRRLTMTPQVDLPFNLNGNLFNLSSRIQGDAYLLDNNFQYSQRTNDYDQTQTNYKPEISLSWRMPLIKKKENSTLLVEPMVSFVSSSYQKNFNKIPNEDGGDAELTVNNLFVNDRIAGFDRNEVGQRVNYGVKTSLFNKYGEFGLNIGQSYRKNSDTQDVVIRGFGDTNKSSVVGQAIYKSQRIFSIAYIFQLNESNYSNDVNQITTTFNFDRVIFSSDYIFLRRNLQNPEKKQQLTFTTTIKATEQWKVKLDATHDMVAGRTLARSLMLYRDGCCTIFGFSIIENNQSNLIKPQKTISFSLSFKNL
jgi:LPS-assembly protein